jgi:hypothetical protein
MKTTKTQSHKLAPKHQNGLLTAGDLKEFIKKVDDRATLFSGEGGGYPLREVTVEKTRQGTLLVFSE